MHVALPAGSSTSQTCAPAHVALPIQRLRPLSIQPPLTRVAVVVSPLASLPLLGSVSAQQPTFLQGDGRAGRQAGSDRQVVSGT